MQISSSFLAISFKLSGVARARVCVCVEQLKNKYRYSLSCTVVQASNDKDDRINYKTIYEHFIVYWTRFFWSTVSCMRLLAIA